MKVYPAIDLMDGKAVRLYKGEKGSRKIYGDPLEIAMGFSELVDKIHIIDLDGAFAGNSRNLEVVEEIISKVGLKVQVGGGFRDISSIRRAYSAGVENVIIGTKALERDFLEEITDEFHGITVSLDCRSGIISLSGWQDDCGMELKEAYGLVSAYVDRIIYTDIERDGTLDGITMGDRFWKDEEVIYAGGVTSIDDIKQLESVGFSGVIIGKAIYEGRIDLEEVLSYVGE